MEPFRHDLRPKTDHENRTKISQTMQNLEKKANSLVSVALMAIFGIYAKFASQRDGCCRKWTLVDPFCGPKEVTKKCPKMQNCKNKAKSWVSEPIVAIFGIYAKFAPQRNGCCRKRALVDLFCGPKEVTKKCPKMQNCKKTKQNPWFQRFSWPFSESTRNLLHNALVVVSNGPL